MPGQPFRAYTALADLHRKIVISPGNATTSDPMPPHPRGGGAVAHRSDSGLTHLTNWRSDWLAVGALLILATGLRLWHLWDIPSPTDELLSVHKGLAIARGELLPLTDDENYIGAFWNYLLGFFYWLTGPNPYVSRGVTLAVGVLTVPASYLLGRELGGRATGLVAAGLLTTSSAHIVATSHPAWSHALAPLFGTLAIWQLLRSVRRDRRRELLLVGLWFGLALQVHLTMLAFGPAMVAFLALKKRSWLGTPWPYLAGLLAIVLISNILVYNTQTGLGTLRRVQVVRDAYTRDKGAGTELYLGNLGRMGLGGLRTISGAIDIREAPASFLTDPLVLTPALLALGGALLLLRRSNPLPLLLLVSYCGLLAYFNSKYQAVPNARFLTPLAPLAFAGIGVAVSATWGRLRPRSKLATPALLLLIGVLVAGSLVGLARRYEQMDSSARTTAGLQAAIEAVQTWRAPDEPILLDRNLDKLWLDGGGDFYMASRFELVRRGIPQADLPNRVDKHGETNPCDRQQVAAVLVDLRDEVPAWLRSALGKERSGVPDRFWTFRIVSYRTRPEQLGPNERLVFFYSPPINGSTRAVERCEPDRLI